MYILGPILGGFIAGNFYKYIKQVEFRLPPKEEIELVEKDQFDASY